MLNVKFICVGKMRERFYLDAFEEYRKRLGGRSARPWRKRRRRS